MARMIFGRDRAEFDRGLGFFDAVYGFAITLLIANVDAPPADAWTDPGALLAHGLGSQLFGFVISFAVIALFWWTNTRLVGRLRGMDGAVIAANLVVAALVVLLPFTTQGISDPEISELPLPTALYAVNVAAAILAQTAMFEIARVRGLVAEDVPDAARWAVRLDVLAQVAVFAVSIPVAYLAGTDWGRLTWAALVVVGPVMGRWSDGVVTRSANSQPHDRTTT
ncbi:DUF1211 domain-containing protein [Leucobacter sp. CSA1]|uniref:DUF1211 domain-containing protein n=1 Tax=Leucobacter chromiisoli TaxID=2796471 RepID=A0A934Q955_9MICO|nr:TMEM175 family protein [Leucobacter chromiisoli]MBK0418837.1 DUF1211 domain-containing protein [Leucobacter chromiisoli]